MEANALQSLDPKELGRRLQEARKARNLNQQAVADHLGVARTTLVAIEKGERAVRPKELVQLASLYGRNVSDFTRQPPSDEAFPVQLRAVLARSDMGIEDVGESFEQFKHLSEDYYRLEQVLGAALTRHDPPLYFVRRATPELAAEDIATTERNRLGLGDGPILNLREMLEGDVGLRIFYMDLTSRVAAMFAYTEALGGCIAVNCNHPPERRRMSLAHEYAHFLTTRFKPEITLLGGYVRRPGHERFAEAFARAFLMPETGLRRRFIELDQSRGGRLTPADLLVLADFFYVSAEALTRRLEELRLLPSGVWDQLQQRGFRVREAQAILALPQRPTEDGLLPTRYKYLAVEAFERGDLSESQFAHLLRVDRLEARRIANELGRQRVVSDTGEIETLSLDLGATVSEGTEE